MIRALALTLAILAIAHARALAQQTFDGKDLYDAHCASCHGLALQGGSQAPPLVQADAASVDFMLQTGRMPAEVPWEEEFHHQPQFSQMQIAAIVDYVMSKSSGEKALPAVHPASGMDALRKGREIFAENCQQCHAATGRGNGAVGYRNVAPSLMEDSPEIVAEAVREGPDVMPRFGTSVIDAQALDDLAAYVRYLQRGEYNAGGLPLANIGPAAEGFVLWAFAMSALVFFVRRIGSTE